jgi:hypothetical protein
MGLEYRVELDIYNGPLDLLLYLIKRDELDIYDIPIARITDSYVEYMKTLGDDTKAEGLDGKSLTTGISCFAVCQNRRQRHAWRTAKALPSASRRQTLRLN